MSVSPKAELSIASSHVRELPEVSFIKALISFMRTPSSELLESRLGCPKMWLNGKLIVLN